MKSSSEIFAVPYEVFQALDPVEKVIIRLQAQRGEVQILSKTDEQVSRA